MAYNDLREWIAALEKAGEVKRIKVPVSPRLEITEITDRVSKIGRAGVGKTGFSDSKKISSYAPGGPALLFENIVGHPGHKVFINQFGSERRMAMALGVERLEQIAERIQGLMNMKAPEGLLDKLKMLPQVGELVRSFPKTVSAKDAPCKQVIHREKINLLDFPVLTCWPHDGGPFITLPCVHTRDPKSGKRNIGMYRMQVYDGQSTGMHWQRQKVAAEHYREALRGAAVANAEANPLAARVAAMAESSGGAYTVTDGPVGRIAAGQVRESQGLAHGGCGFDRG